jgi:serine/threonine-protein kinase
VTLADSSLGKALADRYRLERELGRGGMATVYLARDLKHDRAVALKVLQPELAASLGPERFLREIKVVAGLQHPNILPVHDSGEAANRLWFAMPCVEGESLRARLSREGELPIGEAVRLLRDVVDALAYAHQHGVVHRDIKPDNILLSGHHALVADFGVAKALSAAADDGGLTSAGMAVGTPAYMAPEQAAADPHADHRADIYAVGAMAYEMLTGGPPFTGATPQAVLAAQLTDTPGSLAKARPSVTAALEALVLRCLEKRPADRWQNAEDLLQRLENLTAGNAATTIATAPAKVEPGSASSRRLRLASAVGLILLIAAGVWGWLQSRPTSVLDPDLVAVAPFDVLGADLALWREGLVDVLARNLDGAGPLRTVSPTVVIRRWRGRADPESAAELGRRSGARLAVFGQMVGTSGDSVRISASLYDVGRGATMGEADLRGPKATIDRLADSLTVRLLRDLGRTRPIGAARRATFASASLPALKAFLQGEQEYRRSNWDSALVGYRRAIELDTAFALAYSRLGTILGWQRSAYDSLSEVYTLKAGSLNHGLAPRESLLIAADSLMGSLFEDVPAGLEYGSRVRRLFRTVDEAADRYPDDPLVWNTVGEARAHLGFFVGAHDTWAREPLDRAIATDSAFAPPYIHQVEFALYTEGPTSALRYLNAYLGLGPTDKYADGMRLVRALIAPESTSSSDLARWLDTASANTLSGAYLAVWRVPDSAAAAIRLARLMAEGRPGDRPWSDAEWARSHLARQLLRRGHLQEARELLHDPAALMRWQYVQAALVGGISPDSATLTFRRWLRGGDWWAAQTLWWWAERGDTTSVRHFLTTLDSAMVGRREVMRPYFAQAAPAYLALARRDTARALEQLMALPDSLCQVCAVERLARVRLLSAEGRDREAAARLEAPISQFPEVFEVVWALERGRVHDRLGNRDQAVEAYSFVAQSWRLADPELQPVVAEARAALSRLTGEPRR